MNIRVFTTIAFALLFGTFLFEHIGRKYEVGLRPSIILTTVATLSTDAFTWIGRIIAKISSFYTYIDFDEILETLMSLIQPVIDICKSPFYTIKGYVEELANYKLPFFVVLGSITIILLGLYLYKRYWYRSARRQRQVNQKDHYHDE